MSETETVDHSVEDTPEQAAQSPQPEVIQSESPQPAETADLPTVEVADEVVKAAIEAADADERAATVDAQAALSGVGAQVGHEIDMTGVHTHSLKLGPLVLDELGRVWHYVEREGKAVLRFVGRLVP